MSKRLLMEHKESLKGTMGDFLRKVHEDPDPTILQKFCVGDIVYGNYAGYVYIFEVSDIQVSIQGSVFLIPLEGTAFRVVGRNVSLGILMGYELQEALLLRTFPAKQAKIIYSSVNVVAGITKDEKILLGQFNSFGV